MDELLVYGFIRSVIELQIPMDVINTCVSWYSYFLKSGSKYTINNDKYIVKSETSNDIEFYLW